MQIIPIILVAIGAAVFVYSIIVCRKLIAVIKWPYMRIPWTLSTFIMAIFLIGYALYIRTLFSANAYQFDELWVSTILFIGAVFIAIMVGAVYEFVDWLATTGEDTFSNKRAPEFDSGVLEKERKIVELKIVELNRALEEVSNLRARIEKGRLIDTRKINKRLEEIKKVAAADNKSDNKKA